jgi:chloramphenicol 3-O-phosphotransferase
VERDRQGRIILLNGASSSGKSSIGRALLPLLAEPWFLVPVDAIGAMRSTVHTRILDDPEIGDMLRRTRLGYHRAVAALASAGNDVIMDYPLSEQWRVDDLLRTLQGYDVTLVDVHCSPEELERRERGRGDRPVGLARSQTMVYAHGERDIAVDTTRASPHECAVTIANALSAVPSPKAFDRLRGRRRAGSSSRRMLDVTDEHTHAVDGREEALPGGNMGGAVRVGATVRRKAGPWSPTIHGLLRHLRQGGVAWVPEPLGFDEAGRDSVSYLPGTVPQYPLPAWIWADSVLVDAATHCRELHRVGATFDRTGAVWQLPAHEPAEVICHNDVAPYNMVFVDRQLNGVIDWDTASPGPRSWDMAYLAYRLVPLTDPANGDAIASDPAERARRLRLLCDVYGHGLQPADVLTVAIQRLHDLAAFTRALAEQGPGHEGLHRHVTLYQRDAQWIRSNAEHLRHDASRTDR